MQQIIKGGIIALAVAYDIMSKRPRTSRLRGDAATSADEKKRAA
jgi:hypothetical protein